LIYGDLPQILPTSSARLTGMNITNSKYNEAIRTRAVSVNEIVCQCCLMSVDVTIHRRVQAARHHRPQTEN